VIREEPRALAVRASLSSVAFQSNRLSKSSQDALENFPGTLDRVYWLFPNPVLACFVAHLERCAGRFHQRLDE
jgi:hypothetical protein